MKRALLHKINPATQDTFKRGIELCAINNTTYKIWATAHLRCNSAVRKVKSVKIDIRTKFRSKFGV